MLEFYIFIILIVIVILLSKGRAKDATPQLRQRDKDWVRYILSYKKIVKSITEQKLIQKMLDDITAKSIVSSNELNEILEEQEAGFVPIIQASQSDDWFLIDELPSSSAIPANAEGVATSKISQLPAEQITKPKNPTDSTTILLYFGAFLFIASIGPFIAYQGTNGWARTLLVLIMSMCFYAFGQWIYKTKAKLKSVGLTFVGIGISLAPMVGLAAFNFVEGASASAVWFLTSLICLALYAHALITIRKPLLNYIFIFTLLSVFESGVAIIQVPAYYFGWMMIAVGLLLQAIGTIKNIWPDFKDTTKEGSQIYVPLSMVVSLAVVNSQGIGQLGVTLLLGAVFYGLEAWRAKTDYEYRKVTIFVTQISLLAGLACLVQSLSNDIAVTGWALVGFTFGQIAIIAQWRNNSEIIKNVASVMLFSLIVSIFMLAGNYKSITIILSILVVESLYVWWWQKRDDAYVLGLASWIILPNILGLLAINPHLPINSLISINIMALVLQVIFFAFLVKPQLLISDLETGRQTILIQIILVSIIACFAKPVVALLTLSAISLVLLILSILDSAKHNYWEVTSGLVISLAVIRGWSDPSLLASIMVALAFNIMLALRFRSEANRWFSTILWLLLPIGLGGLTTNNIWSTEVYAWAYIVVMAGLVVSRAIARGVAFSSSKIPLASYARTSSESYVFGYIFAGGLAFTISLFSTQSHFHTTIISIILSLVIFGLAWVIEKDPDLISLQPLLFQVILLSALRPANEENTLIFFAIGSTAVAVVCYLTAHLIVDKTKQKYFNQDQVKQIAIITSLVSPLLVFYAQDSNWTMPAGLAVTAILLFDYWRNSKQSNKEIALSVLTLAFMWFLNILGVKNVQAYTHIIAIMFAGFAYWRYVIGDPKQTNTYIYYALASSTIPLAIQAMGSSAGGLYGWWLLLEQVMFMIIGNIIHKKFVVMWGLYVAVGAVLFQLKDLGFLSMILLALFMISIAVYKIQKSDKSDDQNPDSNKKDDNQ